MVKNKYLEDIGIPTNEYTPNWVDDDDERQGEWAQEREVYGFDSRDCWGLDRTFVEWLYSHLMKYKEDASKRIVLDDPNQKWLWKGERRTQIEMINLCLDDLRAALTEDWFERDKIIAYTEEAIEIWKNIFYACWW